GIVNVTDDSFYPGARSVTADRAIRVGLAMTREGFDLLDVGAVAAAPGPPARGGGPARRGGGFALLAVAAGAAAAAPPVPAADEAERLVPAIRGVAGTGRVPVMADTFTPAVARQALRAGAAAINDTSGGRDPA